MFTCMICDDFGYLLDDYPDFLPNKEFVKGISRNTSPQVITSHLIKSH